MSQQDITDYTGVEAGAIPGMDEGEILGVPQSKVRAKTNAGKAFMLAAVLLGLVFIIFGLLIWQKNKSPAAQDEVAAKPLAAKPDYSVKNEAVTSKTIAATQAEIKKKEEEKEAAARKAEAEAQAILAQSAASAANAQQQQQQYQPPARQPAYSGRPSSGQGAAPGPASPSDRKKQGSVLLGANGSKSNKNSTGGVDTAKEVEARLAALGVRPGANQALIGGSSSGGGQSSNPESLAGRLQGTSLDTRYAAKLPNLDYLLKRGTSIPCALKTGIDTTFPGFVSCSVLNAVYSANGKTLLIDRGATVFGEQQSALKQGQTRTFALWTRIDNPNGVYMNIDSPATDAMGRSGISGYVETYFFQRFGGAIMLSMIKDFSQSLSQRASNNSGQNNTQSYNSTQQATQDMAAEALRNSINIPPTLEVLPGTVVNVLVARDVSFEGVYELRK